MRPVHRPCHHPSPRDSCTRPGRHAPARTEGAFARAPGAGRACGSWWWRCTRTGRGAWRPRARWRRAAASPPASPTRTQRCAGPPSTCSTARAARSAAQGGDRGRGAASGVRGGAEHAAQAWSRGVLDKAVGVSLWKHVPSCMITKACK